MAKQYFSSNLIKLVMVIPKKQRNKENILLSVNSLCIFGPYSHNNQNLYEICFLQLYEVDFCQLEPTMNTNFLIEDTRKYVREVNSGSGNISCNSIFKISLGLSIVRQV